MTTVAYNATVPCERTRRANERTHGKGERTRQIDDRTQGIDERTRPTTNEPESPKSAQPCLSTALPHPQTRQEPAFADRTRQALDSARVIGYKSYSGSPAAGRGAAARTGRSCSELSALTRSPAPGHAEKGQDESGKARLPGPIRSLARWRLGGGAQRATASVPARLSRRAAGTRCPGVAPMLSRGDAPLRHMYEEAGPCSGDWATPPLDWRPP